MSQVHATVRTRRHSEPAVVPVLSDRSVSSASTRLSPPMAKTMSSGSNSGGSLSRVRRGIAASRTLSSAGTSMIASVPRRICSLGANATVVRAAKRKPSAQTSTLTRLDDDAVDKKISQRPPERNVALIRMINEHARNRHMARLTYRGREAGLEKRDLRLIMQEVNEDVLASVRKCVLGTRGIRDAAAVAKRKRALREAVHKRLPVLRAKILAVDKFAGMFQKVHQDEADAEAMWHILAGALGTASACSMFSKSLKKTTPSAGTASTHSISAKPTKRTPPCPESPSCSGISRLQARRCWNQTSPLTVSEAVQDIHLRRSEILDQEIYKKVPFEPKLSDYVK